MAEVGNDVLKALREIEARGVSVEKTRSREGDTYVFGNDKYKVELIIKPLKWLGLEFNLRGTRLWYPINTDLYDIKSPENKWFVDLVEQEIVNFLHNLKDNKLKVAIERGRPVLLIPELDGYVILKQGRLISSKSNLKTLEKVNSKYSFEPLTFD